MNMLYYLAFQLLLYKIPKVGQLEELEGALLLLASGAGSFMSGSSLVVDGAHLNSRL